MPLTVGENVLLFGNPLLGRFHTTGAEAFTFTFTFTFTTVADVFGVCAMGLCTAVPS